jgi:lysophospholipase L1-like esterase
VSALARFDRDVLAQPGVRFVMLMEGINDITTMSRQTVEPKSETAMAEEVVAGYRQIIERAHLTRSHQHHQILRRHAGAPNHLLLLSFR